MLFGLESDSYITYDYKGAILCFLGWNLTHTLHSSRHSIDSEWFVSFPANFLLAIRLKKNKNLPSGINKSEIMCREE